MVEPPTSTREQFAAWVHEVLNRLYDSPFLQTHPLATQRSQQLRRVMLDAIQGMQPPVGTPAQSPSWRAYRILELRYVEGLSSNDSMQQLSLSRSQFFREQARILDALTNLLWAQCQQTRSGLVATQEGTRQQLAQSEMERLAAQATWELVDPVQVLQSVQPMISSLAQTQGVRLQFDLTTPLQAVRSDRVLLRQALLNVITYAVSSAPNGRVAVTTFMAQHTEGILVQAHNVCSQASPGVQRQGVGLEVCRHLLATMGGTLHTSDVATNCWEARLAWCPVVTPTLLVVDDNEGFIDLFQRYLAGHDWRVLGARDGTALRDMLLEMRPTVIVLDIMMPKQDGWELLLELRSNDATRTIPVLICSVLNEPDMADALGATAYLPKPVTQAALLQALAPWSLAASPVPTP
jgi:CheY-like chemotaxis protein